MTRRRRPAHDLPKPPSPARRGRPRWPGIVLAAGILLLAGLGLRGYWGRSRLQVPASGDAFTIYLLGSSTAYGFPYHPRVDLGKLVALLLGGKVEDRRIEVVNLAAPGKTARVVSRDARELVRQAPDPDHSLVFVYAGNNEFTRLDQHHDLTHGERQLFDDPVVSEADRQAIVAGYGTSMLDIFQTLQGAKLAVVASTAAVNLKDWEPNRSVLADRAHGEVVRARLAAADRALARGDAAGALEDLEAILAVEPRFALASKRAGDCCRIAGRTAEARRHYLEALDHDGNPVRETTQLEAELRQACARRNVPLLDAAGLLNAASPDGILGFELLWDNAHPTFGGYLLIARELARFVAAQHGVVVYTPPDSLLRHALVDVDLERAVLNREGQYCYSAATLTFDPQPRLARARGYLERADALGDDPHVACSLAVLAALEGQVEPSLQQWRRAWRLDPQVTRERLDNRYVTQLMRRVGIEDLSGRLE
jgi:lysophospholipase L1-like esterase